MEEPIEIHGYVRCPFAWRVRLVAQEKGVAFVWLPSDVPDRDPRSREHNPGDNSPVLFHNGFTLRESMVISQYLDEVFPGRHLQPPSARERALMRLQFAQVHTLDAAEHSQPTAESRASTERAWRALDEALGEAQFLGGEEPNLADLFVWPLVPVLVRRHVGPPAELTRLHASLERGRARESYKATQPK